MRTPNEARLVAGEGIVGDRYYMGAGKFSPTPQQPDHEITLIESEQVERFNAESGANLEPSELRRNLVTSGVRLNELVDREFRVGDARLMGIRLCEPCSHLSGLTHPGVLRGLVHRCGLRARIVRGAVIRVGDEVSS